MKNSNQPTPSTSGKTNLQNNAIRTGQITIGLGVLMLIYGIYSLTRNPDVTRAVLLGLYLLLIVVGVYAVRLSRAGKSDPAATVIIVTVLIILALVALFLKGLGFIFMLLSILMVSAIAFQALSPHYRVRAVLAGVLVGLFALIIDQVAATVSWRREALLSASATAIMSSLIIVGYFSVLFSQFRSFSLRNKMIIAFLAVTIIPLLIISYTTYTSTTTALTNAANQKLQAAASQAASDIDRFILFNLDLVRSAGKYPAIIDLLQLPPEQRAGSLEAERVYTLLIAMARQDPVFLSSVAVNDLNGITAADTYSADFGIDKSSRNYFKETVASGLPFASSVEHSATSGVPSIYFAAPVRDSTGKLLGIIRIRYTASVLQKLIAATTGLAGESSYGVLLDEHNVRLAHGSDRGRVFKSIVPLEATLLEELQSEGLMPAGTAVELATNFPDFELGLQNADQVPYFAAETNGDGGLEQTAVVAMTTKPWQVAFVQPQSIYLAPINTQTTNTLLIAVLIAALAGVAGFVFSQTLAGPIARLTQAAEAIAGGDINLLAKVETSDEIGALAQAFNRMTQQLRDFIVNLESRVAARTKDLATVAEVGTATATILETDRLLQEVVDLTKERFALYHSHIYLLDEAGENLVLASGAGEVGRTMVAQKRFIPLSREQSLVARAARERKGVTVNDVTQAPDFLPNPLLPETRSELAVPMIVGGKVIGVFDIQSEQIGRFTDSDINIQTTLAAQVATSIQNVRQFEQSRLRAEFETLVNAIGQKIQRAASVDEVLQTAIREVGVAVGAVRVSASLGSGLQAPESSSASEEQQPVAG